MHKIVKSAFKQCGIETTAHGIPNLLRSDRILNKVLWSILILFSVSFCAFLIILSFLDYFAYEVTTKIRVQPQVEIEFPVITICNSGVFTTKEGLKIFQKAYNISMSNDWNLNINRNFNHDFFSHEMNLEYFLKMSIFKNQEMKNKLGLELEQFILLCSISFKECKRYQFVEIYYLLTGKCFKFNGGFDQSGNKVPTLFLERADAGLILLLYSTDLSFEDMFYGNNFYLDISYQKKRVVLSKGLNIMTGYKTTVYLEKSVMRQQPKPYSNCTSDLDNSNSFNRTIYDIMKKLNIEYNYMDCVRLFYQYEVKRRCKCYDLTFASWSNDYEGCISDELYNCSEKVFMETLLNMSNIRTDLIKYCPIECEKTNVNYNIMLEELSYGFLQLVKKYLFRNKSQTIEHLRKNLAYVRLEFKNLEQSEIEEIISMSLLELVANCGGTVFFF
jgi:hypothetical protein